MFNRYWLHILAVGGCLAVGAYLFWAFVRPVTNEQYCKAPTSKDYPKEAKQAPQDGAGNLAVLERLARSVESISAQTDPIDKTERELSDLAAQQDMSCWGFWMMTASFAQVLVGIGGIGVVIVTIRQSRRALGIGQRSLKEARYASQVVVSKDRAFVFVDDILLEQITNKERDAVLSFSATVVWKNSGTTPTKAFRSYVNTNLWVFPLPPEFTHQDFGTAQARAVIPPQASLPSGALLIEYGWGVTAARRDNQPRSGVLMIWGWCEYNDVFPGTPRHRTEFCRQVIINNDPTVVTKDLGVRHFPVTDYNSHDDECLKPILTNPIHDES